MWFLFITVHDRKETELKQRIDSRWSKTLQNWIEHGYLKHGGMAFQYPVYQKPDQRVYSSNSMLYMQLGHLMQRFHVANGGEFSYTLMAIHNQIVILLPACLLGFLAMRLILKTGIPFKQAVLLGLSAQTVYQTFPFSLNFIWGHALHPTFAIFMLGFLILEEGTFCLKNGIKRHLTGGLLVLIMVLTSPDSAFFFFLSYYFIKIINCPVTLGFWKELVANSFSFFLGLVVIAAQLFWVKSNYPQIKFESSEILSRSGFDGDLTYYFNHMDLLSARYLLNLPSWYVLLATGIFSIVVVITIIQRNSRSLNQQTVLLSMVGVYILFAFLLSQTTVIHVYNYGNFLAIPVILALFALLPAWLEILFFRLKHTFVALSVIVAFGMAGVQILAYWIQMPPLWFI